MKFSEIEYKRVDVKSVKKKAYELEKAFRNAKSYEEAKLLLDGIKGYVADEIFTPVTYAQVKNTIDTGDKFYENEVKYYNTHVLFLANFMRKVNKDLISSPFKQEFINDGRELELKIAEVEIKHYKLSVLPLSIKESALQLEYSKTVAQAKTEFDGKQLNFYGLLKEMQSPDRDVRKRALKAWSDLYKSISEKLDKIYDKLIAIRKKTAKRLGYDSYVKYIYAARNIFDYDAEDIKKFKQAVVDRIVPLCAKLREEQRERLCVDKLYFYDEGLFYKEGALCPQGTTEELVEKARQMYVAMGEKTGEFFNFMSENGYFDLETREGKHGGGYCTSLYKYKAPFIFSNFNGTSADVDVLTHEAGHAFAFYTMSHADKVDYSQQNMTMDIAEIHSMSMELFAYPYMESFFGDNADRYRLAHFEEAFNCIPYLCAVDEFQHRVFTEENPNAARRREIWKDIEKTFLPWRDYGDDEFLSGGGFWMQKQHIFLYPFYYVDYALAQVCAFLFYKRELEDHEDAFADYYKLCRIAGKKGYLETLKAVNLKSPFEHATIDEVVDFVKEQIEKLKEKAER